MKERRVALLGQKCWGGPSGPNDETQQFEATQACEMIRERLNAEVAGREKNQNDLTEPVPQLVRQEPLQSQLSELPSDLIGDSKVEPMNETGEEVVEPIEEVVKDPNHDESLRSPPVLPGCLDRNFKCPVSILQHDVDTIVSMGYPTEEAETALVNSRGKLDDAVESLLRSNHQRVAESSSGPPSPSAAELVSRAEPISRAQQQDAKVEIQGNGTDSEEDEEEEGQTKQNRKRRNKAKAKVTQKGKGRGRGRGKGKGQAKAKAKAKSKTKEKATKEEPVKQEKTDKNRKRKTEEKTHATGTKVVRGQKASDKPTTVKKARVGKLDQEPEKENVPRRRKVKDDVSLDAKKSRKSTGTKNDTVTFARRYLPKLEPLRTVWQCARKAYGEIKGNFKAPSKYEDRGAINS